LASSAPLVNYAAGLTLYDHFGNLGGALGGMGALEGFRANAFFSISEH
jgi:hypothetical protein